MSARRGDPEDGVPDENRYVAPMLESVAGAAIGMWVGTEVDPTTGTLVGAALPSSLLAFRTRFNQMQLGRAGRAWNIAAAICEVDPQELPTLADSTSKESLLATALQAAADSVLEEKIVALGKVLADGLRDDALVDTTTMLASAFGDIEAPHIHVLDFLAGDVTPVGPVGPPRAVSLVDFLEANPGYRISISAIVATLERHGIIRTEGEPLKNLAWRAGHMHSTQLPHRYRVMPFGHDLLERLREAIDGPAAARPQPVEVGQ